MADNLATGATTEVKPTTPKQTKEDKAKRRVVNSEGRQMIANVYHFLKQEYEWTLATLEKQVDLSHLRNITKRTAEACKVSASTVERILKEEKQILKRIKEEKSEGKTPTIKFEDPMKKRKKRDNKVDVDMFTADVIRNTIHVYYFEHKQMPTLRKLRAILIESKSFNGCPETLRKVLAKMGYQWQKTEKNKKVLVAPAPGGPALMPL